MSGFFNSFCCMSFSILFILHLRFFYHYAGVVDAGVKWQGKMVLVCVNVLAESACMQEFIFTSHGTVVTIN